MLYLSSENTFCQNSFENYINVQMFPFFIINTTITKHLVNHLSQWIICVNINESTPWTLSDSSVWMFWTWFCKSLWVNVRIFSVLVKDLVGSPCGQYSHFYGSSFLLLFLISFERVDCEWDALVFEFIFIYNNIHTKYTHYTPTHVPHCISDQ